MDAAEQLSSRHNTTIGPTNRTGDRHRQLSGEGHQVVIELNEGGCGHDRAPG
jgi:hypothetical protein